MSYVSTEVVSAAAAAALADSTEIIFSDKVGGRFHVTSGSIATLTWYDATKPGGTFRASLDEYGNAVTQTVTNGGSYKIPDSLAGAAALKAVGNVAGVLDVVLKG